MNLKIFLISTATGALLFGSAATLAFATSAITNGSFENGTDPGVYLTVNAGDSTTITNWKVNSGNIDYIGSYWKASEGNRSLDMNGTTNGSISQDFTTVPGRTYVVTFDMSGNPDGGPVVKTLDVNAAGTTSHYSYNRSVTNNTKTNMMWQSHTFTFKATGTTTTLSFISTTDVSSSFGPALDNVTVGVTPASFGDCNNYQNFVNTNGQTFTSQPACLVYVAQHLNRTNGSVGYSAYGLAGHGQWGVANDGSSAFGAVGAYAYTDTNHDWYIVNNVNELNVSGNTAWFEGQVTSASNPTWVGKWLFAKVVDNMPDNVSGSFVTTESAAKTGVETMSNPIDGPFDVTSGNLTVH